MQGPSQLSLGTRKVRGLGFRELRASGLEFLAAGYCLNIRCIIF